MLHHLSLGVADLARAAAFYDAALGALGYVRVWADDSAVGYGLPGGGDKLALKQRGADARAPGPGFHLAFAAPDRAAVAAFHTAALAAGGRDHGAPGPRPHYGPHYHAAFVIDPDGHVVEAVINTPPPTAPDTGTRDAPAVDFEEIDPARDADAVAAFLSSHPWPFHVRPTLTPDEAREVALGPADEVRAFWVLEHGMRAGLLRALDLDDADDGSVGVDLRLAPQARGRGLGRAAVARLVTTLFDAYPALQRIEATTRADNHAMRRALERNAFVLEGLLRQTWPDAGGTRHDTALYGRLRSDG